MTQAGKQIYLVGNWKSNKTLQEADDFFKIISLPTLPDNTHVVICPPFPYLRSLEGSIELGVQDISPYPFGAYTGAITGEMVKPYARYVIVGHSERRKYFHETNQEVGNKARMAIANGLIPIVCIDEPYLDTQLTYFTHEELEKMIVAYEPLAAIGSGIPDTPEHAQLIAETINTFAPVPVLYGGSVTSDTVKQYVDMPNISGVLVGGASLKTESWSALVRAAID
jgi:triosephosphate isomerase